MPRRGENIYKRKDGRWEGRFIKHRTEHGKATVWLCMTRQQGSPIGDQQDSLADSNQVQYKWFPTNLLVLCQSEVIFIIRSQKSNLQIKRLDFI